MTRQCHGITQTGKRCKNHARNNKAKYCVRHAPPNPTSNFLKMDLGRLLKPKIKDFKKKEGLKALKKSTNQLRKLARVPKEDKSSQVIIDLAPLVAQHLNPQIKAFINKKEYQGDKLTDIDELEIKLNEDGTATLSGLPKLLNLDSIELQRQGVTNTSFNYFGTAPTPDFLFDMERHYEGNDFLYTLNSKKNYFFMFVLKKSNEKKYMQLEVETNPLNNLELWIKFKVSKKEMADKR